MPKSICNAGSCLTMDGLCGGVCPAGTFPKTGDTYCVPTEPCTPDASSIGVEWSGNVTAAGSTRRWHGLGSAVEVLHGILTSKSCETSED